MKKQLVAALLGMLALAVAGNAPAREVTEQTAFNTTEMEKFIADYPGLLKWLGKQNPLYENQRSPWIMSGMRYDKGFTSRLKEQGWEADRFFYLLSHINTGLTINASEKMKAEAQARMEQQKKESEARNAKNQEQMNKQIAEANQRMAAQLAEAKEQIRTNPHIPPQEKQRILDQMKENNTPATQPQSAEAAAQQAKAQQERWLTAQEQAIRANPAMHPLQRQQALEQIRQTREWQKRSSANAAPQAMEPRSQSQEQMQAEMIKQNTQWFANQRNLLENNPSIHPAQKKQMLEQLAASEKQFKESISQPSAQPSGPRSPIPAEEKSLIDANQGRLNELLFPNP
nr:uncharacterized protein [uncultured bacterium]